MKDIKIFLKKKKTKGEKRSEIDVNICPKKKGKNYLSIQNKYYLPHKK